MSLGRKMKISVYGLSLTALLTIHTANADQTNPIQEQGKALIQAFSATLKGELKQAIQAGGLPHGIAVCSEKAPSISAKYSDKQWLLKRTSLKVRNPENTATEFEHEQLLNFQAQKDQGTPLSELSFYEIDTTPEGKVHHIMKAIPTQTLCLACHGDNLAKDVQETLQRLYPSDQATGFQEGDIRGAFSLVYVEKQ